MFPVKEKNDKFRNKSLVLGVRLGTTSRAYPFDELSSIIAYWFAWYAFHPDTEIFHVDVAE